MRIKHFIVTYRNPIWVECVRSILRTPTDWDRSIHVINNHTAFNVPDDLVDAVEVMHNTMRPDWSTGHLARNWNQALLHGFRDLKSPEADIVIASQNDARFVDGYVERLVATHQDFDIITSGDGDNCVSYTAAGVRRVGLWDERFCSIFHQEADFFARAVKYLGARASINDHPHGRVRNPRDVGLCEKIGSDALHVEIRDRTAPTVALTGAIFREKWDGLTEWPWQPPGATWGIPETAVLKGSSYIAYPYFENAVETLDEQRFVR